MTQLEKELTDTSVLVVSDYAKGAIQKDLLQKAIGLAKAQGVPVVVDPKGRDFSKYQFSTVITPNMTEFSAVIDGDLGSEDDILKHGVALLKRYQIDILVLTRSEKGMSVIYQDGRKVDVSTRAKDVVDVTGAGDTVVAAISRCLAANIDIESAVAFANAAAAIVLAKVGTAVCSLDEITHHEVA